MCDLIYDKQHDVIEFAVGRVELHLPILQYQFHT